MKYGAGWVAARRFGASEIIDPKPYAVGTLAETFRKYPALPMWNCSGYQPDRPPSIEAALRRRSTPATGEPGWGTW